VLSFVVVVVAMVVVAAIAVISAAAVVATVAAIVTVEWLFQQLLQLLCAGRQSEPSCSYSHG